MIEIGEGKERGKNNWFEQHWRVVVLFIDTGNIVWALQSLLFILASKRDNWDINVLRNAAKMQ